MAAKHEDPAQTGVTGAHASGERIEKVRDIHGYRVRLEETLPPMPLRDLLSAGGANVFVLSADLGLLETVQAAAGEQYPVFMVEHWADLERAIESGRCGIALVDAASLGKHLLERIELLHGHAASVVTLVAADREEAEGLIGLLSERKIHRLLIKPPAPGITRLLLESAVGRCIQLREVAARTEESLDVPALLPTPSRVPRWIVVVGLAALLAGALAIAAFHPLNWFKPDAPTARSASTPPVATPSAGQRSPAPEARPASERFDDLLARADSALAQGRLAEPAGDNALDYYLTVLAADPDQPVARERLPAVIEALFTQAENDLLNESFDSATRVLAQIRRADPTSPRLQFLSTQLERSKAAAAAASRAGATSPPAVAARATDAPAPPPRAELRAPTELESLLTIATARLKRGDLMEPAGDSAREYVDRAAQLSPGDPRVAAIRSQLASSFVTAAGTKLEANDIAGAAILLGAARRYGAESPDLVAFEARVGEARAQRARAARAALMASAEARLKTGALLAPDDDNAFAYLTKLRQQDSAYPGLDAAWMQLEQGLAKRVNAAIERRDWQSADAALASLRRVVPADSALARSAAHELAKARLQAQYLATAAPASELDIVSYAPPAYPPEAVRLGIEGWVELEFVVGRDGVPRDIATVAADPSGRFQRPAIAAVTSYRYAPFVRDGDVYERRVRLRITFTLK